jgi:hypothetical protein
VGRSRGDASGGGKSCLQQGSLRGRSLSPVQGADAKGVHKKKQNHSISSCGGDSPNVDGVSRPENDRATAKTTTP